jgi:hypothetical protein
MVGCPLAEAVLVNPFATGALHAYVVPKGTTLGADNVGVTEKTTFAQVVAVNGAISAFGLIVTVTVNGKPDPQPGTLGVN